MSEPAAPTSLYDPPLHHPVHVPLHADFDVGRNPEANIALQVAWPGGITGLVAGVDQTTQFVVEHANIGRVDERGRNLENAMRRKIHTHLRKISERDFRADIFDVVDVAALHGCCLSGPGALLPQLEILIGEDGVFGSL